MEDAESERQFVLQAVEDRGIHFVQLWFPDVLGYLKAFAIPSEELPEALAEGASFDGSAIDGFARAGESDMVARPVPRTFTSLPWRPMDRGVARMYCDIHTPGGEPYEGDPRHVLKRVMARAREQGFTAYVGPEIDFYIFRDAGDPEPLDAGTYFDLTPLDVGSDFRRRVITYLEGIGIPVKESHHEGASSQHGVTLRHADPLTIADSITSFRLIVKEVAGELDRYATFMPKPLERAAGSGLHLHLSLFEGERNAFFDPTDEHGLSKVARSFTAGLLGHAREITAVTNQWINSYKRLVPGWEAPTHVSWGVRHRASLVRVPVAKPGKEASARIEYRAPDPACNPYLAIAAILAAGLSGIEEEAELPPETPQRIDRMTEEERLAIGVVPLPESLPEALDAMRHGDLVRRTLGSHVFEWFLANKVEEWNEYKTYVTGFELERYLPRL